MTPAAHRAPVTAVIAPASVTCATTRTSGTPSWYWVMPMTACAAMSPMRIAQRRIAGPSVRNAMSPASRPMSRQT